MKSKFRAKFFALLQLSLFAATSNVAFALETNPFDPQDQPCEYNYWNCTQRCPPSTVLCSFGCWVTMNICHIFNNGAATSTNGWDVLTHYIPITSSNPGFIFQSQAVNTYLIDETNGINSALAFGPGFFFLTTNNVGVEPLYLTIGPWAGSSFVTATTVTNVELYAAPLASLYSTNQIPWVDLGQAVQNTNDGLWGLIWTPADYSDAIIEAKIKSSTATNVFISITLAVQQPTTPVLTAPIFLSPTQIMLAMEGPIGSNPTIQYSTTLTKWTNLVTISNLTGVANFVISANNTNRVGFYRALLN